jgi:tRNA-specific 2-thiouridylase
MSNKVAVAMSGGIDSSVSALLLKEQGFDCIGIFMRYLSTLLLLITYLFFAFVTLFISTNDRNWNSSDEQGEETCPIERDRIDMLEVCKKLQIPAHDVEFSREYWNDVFEPFVDAYKSGNETPNPDIMCNRHIKFKRFREYVKSKFDIDTIATGHYARLITHPSSTNDNMMSDEIVGTPGDDDDNSNDFPKLARGIDSFKDQSYFLCLTQV